MWACCQLTKKWQTLELNTTDRGKNRAIVPRPVGKKRATVASSLNNKWSVISRAWQNEAPLPRSILKRTLSFYKVNFICHGGGGINWYRFLVPASMVVSSSAISLKLSAFCGAARWFYDLNIRLPVCSLAGILLIKEDQRLIDLMFNVILT